MKKHVIITGASGFIGANLTRKLLNTDAKIHLFVRRNSDLWRLKDVEKKLIIHPDVLQDAKNLPKLLKKINPSSLFHLAAYGSYPSQQNNEQMIATNINGTLNLLESVKDISIRRIVVAGSSSEYGKKQKIMNEFDLLEPNNLYAATKAAQTYLCQVYAKNFKIPVTIIRLFNVYGYYEEKGRLVRSVIEAALQNKTILLASGLEARDLIFVEDVVDIMLRASKINTLPGEIFNAGTGKQTSTLALAKKIIFLTKSKSKIKLHAYAGRSWDTTHWVASIKKTERDLKWKSQFSLEHGLLQTIAWYKKQYEYE